MCRALLTAAHSSLVALCCGRHQWCGEFIILCIPSTRLAYSFVHPAGPWGATGAIVYLLVQPQCESVTQWLATHVGASAHPMLDYGSRGHRMTSLCDNPVSSGVTCGTDPSSQRDHWESHWDWQCNSIRAAAMWLNHHENGMGGPTRAPAGRCAAQLGVLQTELQ